MKLSLLLSHIAVALGFAAIGISVAGRGPLARQDATESRDLLPAEARKSELLSEEIQILRERITALEMAPVEPLGSRTQAAGTLVEREEFDAFKESVREALAGRGAMAAKFESESEAFKDQVATTLNEIRKDEAVLEVRAKQERQIERLDASMPKIENWLALTPDQSTRMRSALLAKYDRDAELTRRWENGEDSEILGEIKRTNRETHLTELGQILTPSQLETYSSRGGGRGK